ncbi:hypothetical protein GcC1_173002 [Golovinomyces cichoracearum]|uniref:Uncharacterized protein n=1 Tax=Golovinomyces cichoracearum TaxID=62708 RepID=A0A420HQA2_9PEZI|nr:hypothetical protein GcC1_173002 [Golovinomyces cichoracearum]
MSGEKESQICEDLGSSQIIGEVRGDNKSHSGTIIKKHSAPECSSGYTTTEPTQFKSLITDTQVQKDDFQAQLTSNYKDGKDSEAILQEKSVSDMEQPLLPVKQLKRIASPEEQMVFKFGTAPKPSSYNIKRPTVDRDLIMEASSKLCSHNNKESWGKKSKNQSRDGVIAISKLYEDNKENDIHSEKSGSTSISLKKDAINLNDILVSPISHKKSNNISNPNIVQTESLQLTRNYGKSRPRLPSKKPRIKKPFPEASNIEFFSQSREKKLNSFEQKIIPNFTEKNHELRLPTAGALFGEAQDQNKSGAKLNDDNLMKPVNLQCKQTKIDFEIKEQNTFKSNEKNKIQQTRASCNTGESGRLEFSVLDSWQSIPNSVLEYTSSPQANRLQIDPHQDQKIQFYCYGSENVSKDNREVYDNQSNEIFTNSGQNFTVFPGALSDCSQRPKSQQKNIEQIPDVIFQEKLQRAEMSDNVALLPSNYEKRKLISLKRQTMNDFRKIGDSPKVIASTAACKNIMESCNIILDLTNDCEDKKKEIERQKIQIIELENSENFSRERVKQLETETATFKEKIEHFINIHKKFKAHINEITKSQNSMEEQAKDISQRFDLIEKYPGSLVSEIGCLKNNIQAASTRLESLRERLVTVNKDVDDSNRNLAEVNEKLLEKNKASTAENQVLEIENKSLRSQIAKSDTDIANLSLSLAKLKTLNQELEFSKIDMNEKLRKIDIAEQEVLLEKLHNDKQLQDVITSLENEKGKIMDELEREKIKTERLEKNFKILQENSDIFSDLIRRVPAEMAIELAKDDGVLSDKFINELEKKRIDQAESVTKLVEDLSSRFLVSWEKQDSHNLTLESIKDILKNVQDGLSSSRLHEEAQVRLSTTISNLQKTNEILIHDKNTLADENKLVGTDLNDLKAKLNIFEEDLRVRTSELEAARAISKEIPHLKAQLLSLEAEKIELTSKLEVIKEELLEAKEKSAEAFNVREQTFLELQQKLSSAESRVNCFDQERSEYMTRKENENKKTCQELTQKAEFSKATMKLKLETEVKNLEQRIKDKNRELESLRKELELAKAEILEAKNECQILRAANEEKEKNFLDLEKELGTFKDQLLQQTSRLQALEDCSLEPQEPNDLESRLCSIMEEVSDLRIIFQCIKKDNSQLLDLFSSDQKNIKNNWHHIHDGNRNEKFIGVEDLSLQESLEMLEASLIDPKSQITEGNSQKKIGTPSKMHPEENTSESVAPEENGSDYPVVQENSKMRTEPETDLCATISLPAQKYSDQMSLQKTNDKNKIVISSHGLQIGTNPSNVEKHDQFHYNANSIIHEENPIIRTPIGQVNFQTNPRSGFLATNDKIIDAHSSVSHPKELTQKYEKTRKLRDLSCNTDRSASIFSFNNQESLHGESKRKLNQNENEGKMLDQQNCERIGENEHITKRQRSVTNIPPSISDVIRHRSSGTDHPIKNSLRSRAGQESLQHLSNTSYEIDISYGAALSGQSVNEQNRRAEPTESNVKQRRQGPSKSSLKGVNYDCGAKFETPSKPVTKLLQTADKKSVGSDRSCPKVKKFSRKRAP